VDEKTVAAGVKALETGEDPLSPGRVRKRGGGRKPVEAGQPGIAEALLGLVEPTRRGDPQSALAWTTLSLARLSKELAGKGFTASIGVVRRILAEQGFSLQANAKTLEGGQHPDRDQQFSYLNDMVAGHQASADPVISVDTKKKELVGDYKNKGVEWRPAGCPEQVKVHDFIGEQGRANPYGVYDVTADTGWVSVGTDHDTAEFAVNTIRSWWTTVGAAVYPGARRLLVTADAGGSNGHRVRLWKTELARFAADTGLAITVCHLPPGTSKWNKIEHRLFSHISMNWRGRPLTSHETIVNLIGATTTRSGLAVTAVLDDAEYPNGVKIPDTVMDAMRTDGTWQPHEWHGDWNYTITPPDTTTRPLIDQ